MSQNKKDMKPVKVPKKIVILGSTGSIGENVLRVVEKFPERFQVIGLAAQRQVEKLFQQAKHFNVKKLVIAEEETAQKYGKMAPAGVAVLHGMNGMEELASAGEADIVVAAVVGIAGLKPVLAALRHGIDVALATKEVMAVAGTHVLKAREKSGAMLLPIDSEHSAIFQCLAGHPSAHVRKIILTASGGPFAGKQTIDFDKVTTSEALKHPRWNMGKKVTVDSATMMNKGLEIMEARWLFNIDLEKIEVLIHPESIVHSLVEFVDGAVLAQLSVSDMRFAIQYALTYPERLDGHLPSLNLSELGPLRFFAPDEKRFPCLALARRAANEGGTMPAVLNAANEVAVHDFLQGKIKFSQIWQLVEKVMEKHLNLKEPSLEDIMQADQWARMETKKLITKGS
jgi:1-deoxy-D-xylulose-5-phosphate reductoisomerase